MFSKSKFTKIYFIVDDFRKEFASQQKIDDYGLKKEQSYSSTQIIPPPSNKLSL